MNLANSDAEMPPSPSTSRNATNDAASCGTREVAGNMQSKKALNPPFPFLTTHGFAQLKLAELLHRRLNILRPEKRHCAYSATVCIDEVT